MEKRRATWSSKSERSTTRKLRHGLARNLVNVRCMSVWSTCSDCVHYYYPQIKSITTSRWSFLGEIPILPDLESEEEIRRARGIKVFSLAASSFYACNLLVLQRQWLCRWWSGEAHWRWEIMAELNYLLLLRSVRRSNLMSSLSLSKFSFMSLINKKKFIHWEFYALLDWSHSNLD